MYEYDSPSSQIHGGKNILVHTFHGPCASDTRLLTILAVGAKALCTTHVLRTWALHIVDSGIRRLSTIPRTGRGPEQELRVRRVPQRNAQAPHRARHPLRVLHLEEDQTEGSAGGPEGVRIPI